MISDHCYTEFDDGSPCLLPTRQNLLCKISIIIHRWDFEMWLYTQIVFTRCVPLINFNFNHLETLDTLVCPLQRRWRAGCILVCQYQYHNTTSIVLHPVNIIIACQFLGNSWRCVMMTVIVSAASIVIHCKY